MKRILAGLTALILLAVFASCGQQTSVANTANADPAEPENAAQETNADRASAAYAAFLGQFEAFSPDMEGSLYVQDVNGDGYPEIIIRPAWREDGELVSGAAQYMATYTDKGGLCVISPDAHSSMGVHFRVSEDNCLYYTDDGHNVGTSAYHSGYIYSVDETGFVLKGQVFGDDWPEDADLNDLDVVSELDEKYDQIFADKIRAITGDKPFTDCSETQPPEDMDAYLNEALHIDIASARQAWADAQTRLPKLIADAAGKEPKTVYVSDYDRDGAYEAFAFFGERSLENGLAIGSVWFVNAQGEAKQIQTEVPEIDETGKFSGTYHDYFQAPLLGGSSSPTSVWEVRGGDCARVELFDSPQASLEIVKPLYSEFMLPGTLISTRSAFDATIAADAVDEETGEPMGSGHSHKPYFFRDTPDGIKEYGGIEISQAEIEKMSNGKELLKLAQEDGKKIESVYYRDNGVISFSMSRQTGEGKEYSCFNTLLSENRLCLLSLDMYPSDGENSEYLMIGFYTAAADPENATFPVSMP